MVEIWLMALAVTCALNVVAIIWLMYNYAKLKRQYEFLQETITRQGYDIAGLCTAALTVDENVGLTGQQLTELWEKISDVQLNSQSAHTYSSAIQKARGGASIHELMQGSGISHDEAALLIRLHGDKSKF
jgi:hypothetical protein